MPVSVTNIRDILLPGLMEMQNSYAVLQTWQTMLDAEAFASFPGFTYSKPPIPMIGPVAAVAIGTAAVVIKNPEVTRRFLPWRS